MLIGEEFSAPDEQNTSIIFKKTTPHNICIFLATIFRALRRKLVETMAPRVLCEPDVLHCKKTVFWSGSSGSRRCLIPIENLSELLAETGHEDPGVDLDLEVFVQSKGATLDFCIRLDADIPQLGTDHPVARK